MYLKFLPVTGALAATAILAFVADPLHAHDPLLRWHRLDRGDLQRRQPQWNRETCRRTHVLPDRRQSKSARSRCHIVVGWTSKRNAAGLLTLLAGSNLPPDATAVKPYNGYCAVFRSAWLGRVDGLPYIIVYAPQHRWWNGVNTSLHPLCRG